MYINSAVKIAKRQNITAIVVIFHIIKLNTRPVYIDTQCSAVVAR